MLTLEYLVIFALSLVLLTISLSSLERISVMAGYLNEMHAFKADALMLRSAIEETCILGAGNSRELFVGSELIVDDFEIRHGDFAIALDVPCDIDDAEVAGKTTIKNNGRIILG